jgi:hypothetical protein
MKTNKGMFPITIIFLIIGILAVGAASHYAWKNKGNTTMHDNNATLSEDVYPLFPEVSWQEPVSSIFPVGDRNFEGVQVNSKTVTITEKSPTDVRDTFKSFYEEKLTSLGYEADATLDADGVHGSQWAYKKGGNYIILSWDKEPLVPKDEVGGGDCPCNLQFSIFTGIEQQDMANWELHKNDQYPPKPREEFSGGSMENIVCPQIAPLATSPEEECLKAAHSLETKYPGCQYSLYCESSN